MGTGISRGDRIAALFGDKPVEGKFNEDGDAVLTTPAAVFAKFVMVTIVMHDGYKIEGPSFEYLAPVRVHALHPTTGTVGHALSVSVTGEGFEERSSCWLPESMQRLPTTFVSTTVLHCSVQVTVLGTVTVEVASAEAELVSSDGVQIEGVEEMFIERIVPSIGAELKAQSITVYGSNFVDTTWLLCRFGKSTPTGARFVSSTSVVCMLPPMKASNVSVALTHNGMEYTTEGPRLSLAPTAELMSASPSVSSVRGGTTVTVSGRGFQGGVVSGCRFGEHQVDAEVLTDDRIVCTSPAGYPGTVMLRLVSSDGVAVAGPVAFTVRHEPKVMGMYPRRGVIEGGSPLTVYGEHLDEYDLKIMLGTAAVADMTIVSSSLVVCRSGVHVAGPAPVTLEYSGVTESVADFVFRYYEKPSVQRLAPSSGPQAGGTPVLVYGSFRDDLDFVCRFGRDLTQAEWLGSSTLKCLTPRHGRGIVALEVSFNSVDFSSTSSAFEFEAGLEVQVITPTSGPTQGGTAVSIFGHNFMQSDQLQCLVGNEFVPARFINAGLIICVTPVMRAGEIMIAVSNNGVDMARAEKSFTAYEQTAIMSILPSTGPTRGGTAVDIVGSFGDISDVSCRFGDTMTAARLLSSSVVRCFSPAASAGKVAVHVMSGREVVTKGTNMFAFEKLAAVRSVVPSSISESSGRLVTVVGESFEQTDQLVCLFGGRFIAQSLVRSSTQVVCQVEALNLGNVSVEISANGQDFTSDLVGLMITPDASLRAVSPSTGTVRGGTVVTLLGSHFAGEQIQARFGDVVTDCAVTTSSMLSCMTPPNAEGRVSVEVPGAPTASTLQAPVVFLYGQSVEVVKIRPSTGQSSGGTPVTVIGRHFVDSNKLGCRFGERRRIVGQLMSSSMMVCESPQISSDGEVSVEVTNNGVDYSSDERVFTYQAAARVERFEPSAGAASSEHVVTVYGSNFARSSTLSCFGKSDTLYPAKWLSSKSLVCTMPASSFVGNMTIEVSNNGVDVSNQGVQFVLLPDMHVLSVEPASVIEWGGETVTVTGLGFPSSSPTLNCVFGELQVQAEYLSASTIACVAPGHAGGEVNLQVKDEQSGMASEALSFTFHEQGSLPLHKVTSVSPSFGPVRGSTRVLVTASGFTSGKERCVFGTMEAAETIRISDTVLECITPLRDSEGCVTVHVLDEQGRDLNLVHLQYCYERQANVYAVTPSSGHWMSQHLVTVYGESFQNRESLVCRLGEGDEAKARWITMTEVLCVIAPRSVGRLILELSNNGLDFTTDGVTFEARSLVKLMSVKPSAGMLTSGLEVTLALEDSIQEGGLLFCRFGSKNSTAVLKADGRELTCAQPISLSAEVVEMSVYDLGVQISTAMEFAFVPVARVESITPSRGPIEGGTPITLIGSNFESLPGEQFVCRIGGESSEGRVISSSLTMCSSPPSHVLGPFAVEVSPIGGADYAMSNVHFEYDLPVVVSALQPSQATAGQDVTVRVSGSNFLAVPSLTCRFGISSFVRGMLLDGSMVACPLPSHLSSGNVSLEVANNGVDFSEDGLRLSILASSDISISPSQGPVVGGTRITLFGLSSDDNEIPLLFGDALVVALRAPGASQHTAVTPRGIVGTVAVAPAAAALSSAEFEYQKLPDVHTLYPSSAPLGAGGALITVHGAAFPSSGVLCRFSTDGASSTSADAPAAAHVSDTELVCPAPETDHAAGVVGLSLSVNGGADWSAPEAPFLWYNAAEVHSVEPSVGPAAGGYGVTVHGANFIAGPGALCRFGRGSVTRADVLSSSQLLCDAPRARPGAVALEVSPDGGVFFSASGARFLFRAEGQWALAPTAGPTAGGTLVTVSGPQIGAGGGTVALMFGGARVAPYAVAPGEALFLSPPAANGDGDVRVMLADEQLLSEADRTTRVFRYLAPPEVRALLPSAAPATRPASVTVVGAHLGKPGATAQFRLAALELEGVVVSSSMITVALPPRAPGSAQLSLAADLGNAALPGLAFESRAMAEVLSVRPSQGHTLGGAWVELHGLGFGNGPDRACRFGLSGAVAAVWYSDTHVACRAPPRAPGNVTLEYAADGVSFTSSGAHFAYMEAALVSVDPSFGPVGGGTVVTIDGAPMPDVADAEVWCAFAVTNVAATRLNGSALTCVSPPSFAGTVVLELSHVRGRDWRFLYEEAAVVHAVTPAVGSVEGGTLLQITGAHFSERHAAVSVAGSLLGAAAHRWVSSSLLLLRAPPAAAPGLVQVEVTNAPGAAHQAAGPGSTQAFRYASAIAVSDVYPAALDTAARGGGGAVTVVGSGFMEGVDYACRFGAGGEQPAVVLGATRLRCMVGPGVSGNLTLDVGYAEDELLRTNLSVTLEPAAVVDAVFPLAGGTAGGTTVTVVGRNFRQGAAASCVFGDVEVEALVLSNRSLECVAPFARLPGPVSFEVLVNHTAIAQPAVAFRYLSQPRLSGISPDFGPASGNTLVTVFGQHLTGLYAECLFGASPPVPAEPLSSTALRCASPPSEAGPMQVAVAVAVEDRLSATQVPFSFRPAMRVLALAPSAGTVDGGTLLTVAGENFLRSESIACRFGGAIVVAGEWISDSSIRCATPESDPGNRTVEVTSNGADFTAEGLVFVYLPRIALRELRPSSAPAAGGSRVTFLGEHLSAYDDLTCRFGGAALEPLEVADDTVVCLTPSARAGRTDAAVVSYAHEAALRLPFVFYPDAVLAAVEPSFGVAAGGTPVTARGRNFAPGALCKFGARLAAGAFVSSSTLLCYPPATAVSEVPVEVSNNGQDYTDSGVAFAYVAPSEIAALDPSVGPGAGGTLVTVSGAGFVRGKRMQCRFGSARPSEARWVSEHEVHCVSPPSPPANVSLSVTFNGEEFVAAPRRFVFEQHISVLALAPLFGPTTGNTPVVVLGQFTPSSSYMCRFGATAVEGAFVSATELACVSPAGEEGPARVEVSANGVDWTGGADGAIRFSFHPPLILTGVLPSTGSVAGGTRVQLFGANLVPDAPLFCRFGDAVVDGSVIDAAVAECVAPPRVADTLVRVEISHDNAQFSNEASYLYQDVSIAAFYPAGGPISGGTDVNVRGSGFLPLVTLRCRFGETVVAATWVSSEELWCVAPPGSDAEVDLEVSNNDADFSAEGNKFEYQAGVAVSRVLPSAALTTGNTPVTVLGKNFLNSSSLVCRFGIQTVDAQEFLSPFRIVCVAPAATTGGVTVEVSNNRHDFTRDGVTVMYFDAPVVAMIVPSSGPAAGQSIVTVVGDKYINAKGLSCKFGEVAGPAEYVSPSLITCRSPYARRGPVSLEVSNNGADFTTQDHQFLYYDDMVIESVSPSAGPSHSGGTLVLVTARGVRNTLSLACRFGPVVVPAQYVSETAFECRAPPSAPGMANVEATLNRLDYTSSGQMFLFQDEVTVRTLIPNSGLDFGGLPVFITGEHFFNSSALVCRFGARVVKAVFLSESTLFCLSPPQPPGSVEVAVSNNGVDFTTERLLFHSRVCPVGSFVIGNEVVQCPAGSYCPATGLFNFSLCAPGLYQDKPGQDTCLKCTAGSICPDFGMPFPQPCPPGYVCDKPGLVVAEKPCPPGHYCLTGTTTSNSEDLSVKQRPLPCPQGFYCAAGAVTSVSIISNYSTPQPCFPGYFCNPGSESPHGQGPCPSGFHCPQYSPGMVRACPPGTFCPTVGNVEPLPCKPGSFNEHYAQSVCSVCPIGRMCPSFGLLAPRGCPAGYVCDEAGKATWSKLCPSGYWCMEGTVTANASSALEPRPLPCAPGTYCLVGVSTNRTVPGSLDAAQICVEGTYCGAATGSPQGTAPCPRGFYCPAGVSEPTPASPGYYVSRPGSVRQVPCTPGTFTATVATVQCIRCPAGHSCAEDGTIDPVPCPAGSYRSLGLSVSCLACPTGTWSSRTGVTAESLCEPCPPGVVCSVAGMTTLNISAPCPEGYVCEAKTNAEKQFQEKCPAGYVCPFGTTPATQFDMLCEPGYGCPEGTSFNTRKQLQCAPGFYCPEGSTSPNPLQTKCPIGTHSNEGARSVDECFRVPGISSICRVSPYYEDPIDTCELKLFCWKTSPESIEQQEQCFQIKQAEAGQAFEDNLIDSQRRDQMFHYLEAFGVAEVQLDFRNLPPDMRYLDHYEVAVYYYNNTNPFAIHRVIDECSYLTERKDEYLRVKCSEYSGTWFESREIEKRGLLSFSISAHTDIYFRVEVEMFHGRYLDNKNYTAFRGTMSLNTHYPSRAKYGACFEDTSIYDDYNETEDSNPECTNRRAQEVESDCLVTRNGERQPCAKQFLIMLDGDNQDLNVALNVERPFKPDEDNDPEQWQFQTMPWVDFTSTDPKYPLLPQPFNTQKGSGIMGVGNKNEEAYPVDWVKGGKGTGVVGSGDKTKIMLPYFPFFSQCRGFDSHIQTFRVMESRQIGQPGSYLDGGCNLTKRADTVKVDQWNPITAPSDNDLISGSKIVDVCTWNIPCVYEEQIDRQPLPLRWFSQPPGATLFYMTMNAFDADEFRDLEAFKALENTNNLVAAQVSDMSGSVDATLVALGVPKLVVLTIQYYQREKSEKRIIQIDIDFADYTEVANADDLGARDYTLQINFQAMSWMPLLNKFAFDLEVYIVLFSLVAGFYLFFAVIFWAIHRIFTRLSAPLPPFRFYSYLRLTSFQPVQGFCLALIPIFASVFFMELFFMWTDVFKSQDTALGPIDAEHTINENDLELLQVVRDGRFAVGLFTFGMYAMFQSAKMLTPEKEALEVEEVSGSTESEESAVWRPELWHRTHLVFAYLVTVGMCTVLYEFSLSPAFSDNFYECLMLLELWKLFYGAFLEEFIGETFMVGPHDVVIDLVVTVATMGASSLMDFILGGVIGVLMEIAFRVYVDPGINWTLEKWDYLMRLYQQYKRRQEMLRDEEEGGGEDDDDEDLWMDLEEDEDKSPVEDIIGSYASYSTACIVMLYGPFVVLFVQWTERYVGLAASYGIKSSEFKYFSSYAAILIVPTFIRDIFMHNVVELFHGWKLYDYVKYCKHRYAKRQFRWKARDPNEDESIGEGIRSLDLMCFSSQYYFILAISPVAPGYIIMSIQTLLRQQDRIKNAKPYNPFSDKMMPFIVVLCFAVCKLIHWTCVYFGYRLLWRHKAIVADFDEGGMLLDDGKDKLELPDWGGNLGKGMGGGGGYNIDITSDSFKHRFFEANKPWIIEQLRKTMSPRAQLEALTRGDAFDEGDLKRGDISDDEGSTSESEDGGLELDATAKLVARRWLSKTRRRLGLPDRAQAGLDISSDDESSDAGSDDAPPPKLSAAAQQIAREWLNAARGVIRQGAPEKVVEETRGDISSDDSSEDGAEDRPVIAMSAKTRVMAELWLARVRGEPAAQRGARAATQDISDDDSSSDGGDDNMQLNVGPKAKAIAREWLSRVRRTRPPAEEISDDSSSSDSDTERGGRGASQVQMSNKTRAIAIAWLRNVRRMQR